MTDIRGVKVVRRLTTVGRRIIDLFQAAAVRWMCAARATSASVCVVEFLLECLDVLGIALWRHREVKRASNWAVSSIQKSS